MTCRGDGYLNVAGINGPSVPGRGRSTVDLEGRKLHRRKGIFRQILKSLWLRAHDLPATIRTGIYAPW
jgi:hypothetical protein